MNDESGSATAIAAPLSISLPAHGPTYHVPPNVPPTPFLSSASRAWELTCSITPTDVSVPFAAYIFLGPAPEDPDLWDDCPARIGCLGVSHKENCSRPVKEVVSLTRYLSHALREIDPRLGEDAALKFLRENLWWAVLKDGEVVDLEECTSLEVKVRDAAAGVIGGRKAWRYHECVREGKRGRVK